jgi:catechol 2,3-dioxygenase-like lactoylglutathione lyase family enzyme
MVLRVSDWRRSADWYQNVLGFERRKGQGFSGYSHPGANFILLFRSTGEIVDASSVDSQRLEHIALYVPTEEDLVAWQKDLATKGIEADIDRVGVGTSITLHDPDGLEVELFTPAPGGVLDVSVAADALSVS